MKVNTFALRSLSRKVKPSILTGAIDESADYIDELEKENERYKKALNDVLFAGKKKLADEIAEQALTD